MAVRKRVSSDLLQAPDAGSAPVMSQMDSVAQQQDAVPPREQWTLNGEPIPAAIAQHIFFQHTDQYRALQAAKPGMKPSGVSIVSDEWSKMLEQRADQPWASSDPIKGAVDGIKEPGFRYRALSPIVNEKRGLRGWDVVKDKKGDPIKVGRLIIGRMPIVLAEERNAHYMAEAADQLQGAEENLRLTQEKAIRNLKGGADVQVLRSGDVVKDSSDPRRSASIGVSSSRGSGAVAG